MTFKYKHFTMILTCLLTFAGYQNLFATIQTIMVGGASGMSFVPASGVTINLGDTIKWEWQNGSHTTTSTTIPSGAASWDEPINASTTTFLYVPTVPGIYNYICIPHQAMGMIGSFTVVCTPPTMPSITPSGLVTACSGDSSALLTAIAGTGVEFQWQYNGNPIPGATTEQWLPDSSGIYTCMVTNACGSATSPPVTVTLQPSPTPSFTQSHANLTYTFNNTTTDTTLSWLWDFGDGTTGTDRNPQHTYGAEGHYTVTLTATDTAGNGCSGMATAEIEVTTGIDDLAARSHYQILPNPATSFVDILSGDGSPVTGIQIYAISGRLLKQLQFPDAAAKSHVRVEVRELPSGIYFIRVTGMGKTGTQKLVIRP